MLALNSAQGQGSPPPSGLFYSHIKLCEVLDPNLNISHLVEIAETILSNHNTIKLEINKNLSGKLLNILLILEPKRTCKLNM